MPFLLNLAPLVLVLLVLAYLGTIWRHAPARWALVAGALGGVGGSVLYVSLVLQQRSSTAAIGFLFTPWVFAVAAGSAAAWGFGLHALVHTRQALRGGPRRVAVWAGAVLFLLTSTYYTGRDARSVAGFLRIKWGSVDAPLLEDAYRRALARRDTLQLAAIAAHPSTPPATLLAMARSEDPLLHDKRHGLVNLFDRDALAVVRHVLRNPHAPREVVASLARSPSDYVLYDVAVSPHATEAILRDLARRRDSYLVRWGLALNAKTPPDILEELARDADNVTTQHLAGNPGTPLPIIRRLADSGSALARAGVAKNPAIDAALMDRLAGDPEDEVRLALAINPAATQAALERLARDENARVRRYAGERLGRKGLQ